MFETQQQPQAVTAFALSVDRASAGCLDPAGRVCDVVKGGILDGAEYVGQRLPETPGITLISNNFPHPASESGRDITRTPAEADCFHGLAQHDAGCSSSVPMQRQLR